MLRNKWTWSVAGIAIIGGGAWTVLSLAQGGGIQFQERYATTGIELDLRPATEDAGESVVSIEAGDDLTSIVGNGIPSHPVGEFPNEGNPNEISAQDIALQVPTNPELGESKTELAFGWNFGVTVDGVVLDPLAAEFWAGNPRSGWNYNALGGAFDLGLDTNYAHVQPTGTYHYHGVPVGLVEELEWDAAAHSPLVGYGADGFPIYVMTGIVNGQIVEMTSSYRLKPGNRPGGDKPDGAYDGTFEEDYEYVEGLGQLDECNGAVTVSPEYPDGIYAYFLTENYPVIPRCFAGAPDESFRFAP